MEEWQFSLEALILTFIFDHKETNYKLWSNTNFKKKKWGNAFTKVFSQNMGKIHNFIEKNYSQDHFFKKMLLFKSCFCMWNETAVFA